MKTFISLEPDNCILRIQINEKCVMDQNGFGAIFLNDSGDGGVKVDDAAVADDNDFDNKDVDFVDDDDHHDHYHH